MGTYTAHGSTRYQPTRGNLRTPLMDYKCYGYNDKVRQALTAGLFLEPGIDFCLRNRQVVCSRDNNV